MTPTPPAPRVLVVEDDPTINQALTDRLVAEGFEVSRAHDGPGAVAAFAEHDPQVVVLDLMLPGFDGLEVCRRIQAERPVPVLMLTARDEESDIIVGLGVGADDYLTKPFGTAELLARVRTAIRHTRTTSANSEIAREGTYTVGEMTIDYNKHQVLVRGENVHLTLSEFRIVALLGKFAGKVLTYDYIIKELWGPRAGGDNQILRVNMANIRRKIEKNPAEPEYLFTEVGVGYRMAENSEQ